MRLPNCCAWCGARNPKFLHPVQVRHVSSYVVLHVRRTLSFRLPACATCEAGFREWRAVERRTFWVTAGTFLAVLIGFTIFARHFLVKSEVDKVNMLGLAFVLAVIATGASAFLCQRWKRRLKSPPPDSWGHVDIGGRHFVFANQDFQKEFDRLNEIWPGAHELRRLQEEVGRVNRRAV